MGTGLHYLEFGLGIAVFIGIFWLMHSVSAKSLVRRKQELSAKKIAHQPWDNDKAGGRGNR